MGPSFFVQRLDVRGIDGDEARRVPLSDLQWLHPECGFLQSPLSSLAVFAVAERREPLELL